MAAKKTKSTKSQSTRLLEAAKKASVADNSFARSMGKLTLAKQGRKAARMK